MAKKRGNSPKLTLTSRQREVFECIKRRINTFGYGPTVREIGDSVGINSPNGVVGHLKALQKKGLISRQPHLSRSIRLQNNKDAVSIKKGGTIANGLWTASETSEVTDMTFVLFLEGENLFIEVTDTSFKDLNIAPGDIIVIRTDLAAKDGQTVMVKGSKIQMKTWGVDATKKLPKPTLENEEQVPTSLDYPEIVGLLAGVLRSCL